MTDSYSPSVQPMEPTDYLLYRGEHNPRTRAVMLGIEYLERSPEWDRLTETFERASRVVPRLRQKVVVPALPSGSPCWVTDPDFDLSYHLRRMRLREGATHREVLDFAERLIQAPLDPGRALWEAVLIEDLEDGRAALLTKQSHAVSDGVGGVQMAEQLYDLEPNPAAQAASAASAGRDVVDPRAGPARRRNASWPGCRRRSRPGSHGGWRGPPSRRRRVEHDGVRDLGRDGCCAPVTRRRPRCCAGAAR